MEKATAFFSEGIVFSENDKQSKILYDKSRYGELKRKKIYFSLFEAAYLMELDKLELLDGRNNTISLDNFIKKVKRYDKKSPM